MKKLFLLLFLSLFIFPIGLKANSAHTETSRTNITSDYYNNYSANAHRGDYDISLKVDNMYEKTRDILKLKVGHYS